MVVEYKLCKHKRNKFDIVELKNITRKRFIPMAQFTNRFYLTSYMLVSGRETLSNITL